MSEAIKAAFEAVGYWSATDRLRDLALDVCRLPPEQLAGSTDDARDPVQTERLRKVAMEACKSAKLWDAKKDALYNRIRDDPVLLWELFQPYRATAVQALLTQATEELRRLEQSAKAASSALGHPVSENQMEHAQRANHASLSGWGQLKSDRHRASAPSAQSQARTAMTAVAEVARLSLLDTFKINGRPIGDLTPAEALRWAGARERDARFVRLLTANLPDDTPIRKHRRAEDTQALYEQASVEIFDAQ